MTAPTDVYYVGGCRCCTGQGYSPCSCTSLVELDAADYALWTRDAASMARAPMDLAALKTRADARTDGRVVHFRGSQVLGECAKDSKQWALLMFYRTMRDAVYETEPPRFKVAYDMNGNNRYWCAPSLSNVLEQFDAWEGVCRSWVDGAIFVDEHSRRLWSIARPPGNSWCNLVARDGLLAELVEPPAKKQKKTDA